MSNREPSSADREFIPDGTSSDAIAGSTSRTEQPPLHNRAILVVEDEYLIAEDLRVILKDAGAEVIGPADSLPKGIRLASETERIEAALLNVFLNGVTVFPLVDELRTRGIPMLFLTGYDDGDIPDQYSDIRRCQKPLGAPRIVEELRVLLRPVAA